MTERCVGDCRGHPLHCYDHPHDCPCSAEPSDEDVERVARAIEPELFKPIPSGVMWNPIARRMAKQAARDKARAAITALRAKP